MNWTAVAPVRSVPAMRTEVPGLPLVGENNTIAGAGVVTVKLLEEVAVPCAVVTEILPVVALVGTAAVIWVELLTVNAAESELTATAVTPEKLLPVMVTEVPTGPDAGVKLAIVGA